MLVWAGSFIQNLASRMKPANKSPLSLSLSQTQIVFLSLPPLRNLTFRNSSERYMFHKYLLSTFHGADTGFDV